MRVADPGTPLLRVERLHVERDGTPVLHDVSLHAARGEVLAVLGPNGSGKSTLLRSISGTLPATGHVVLDGRDAIAMDARERARVLAYLPQRSLLEAPLPVERVVAQARYAHTPGLGRMRNADRDAVEDAMRTTRVTTLRARPFTALSYGEQRRVLLARALATRAPLLLLDEPAAALDIAHALSLFDTLRALAAAGHAVVVVVHQLDDAFRHADRGLLLHEGRALAHGPIREVLTADRVARVWGVEMREGGGYGFSLSTTRGDEA